MNKALFGSIAGVLFLAACGRSPTPEGCTMETAAAFCDRMADQGKVCGHVTDTNNCAQETRTEDCGTAACTGATPVCHGTLNTCVSNCPENYIFEDGACINSKQVACIDAAPRDATSTPSLVTITYTTAGGWSTAEDCPWTCDPGYERRDDGCLPEHASWGCNPSMLISQIYFNGGSDSGRCDFVELHNRGDRPMALNGWALRYASAGGTSWEATPLGGTIGAGAYSLVRMKCGSSGTDITTYDNAGSIDMSETAGTVALVAGTMTASCTDSAIVDMVGYGTGVTCSEGTAAPAPLGYNALMRPGNSCEDSNDNSVDFVAGGPYPRSSSSAAYTCGCAMLD